MSSTESPDEPQYFLLEPMRAIERAVHREMLQAVHEAGYPYIGIPHISFMAHMTSEGRRISEFAGLMQVTKSAASQIATDLELHGLVERVRDPHDGRAVVVRATPAADRGFRAARRRLAEREREWERRLGESRLQELASMLRAVETWSTEAGDASP